jgi:hypothetical protein
MQNKQQGPHLREVHTYGVHTPKQRKSTPKHLITPAIQLPTLICDVGAHLLLSPHLNCLRPGSLTHGREEAQEKSLARITDLKTVHNLWTQTIAVGLNTLQRLYNCTRPNRARMVANHLKPYHTAGVQVSG